jgi:hypothetical protein
MSSQTPSLISVERDPFGEPHDFEDEAKTTVMPTTLSTLYAIIHRFQNIEASTAPKSLEKQAATRVCMLLERAADEAEILGPLLS